MSHTFISRSTPINRLPNEVLVEVFKIYAESYPELLDQTVVDLPLVSQHWNAVANATPQLWTKINLSHPFENLQEAKYRVGASKRENIDISIYFCDPDWDGEEPDHDVGITETERGWVKKITEVLNGTEERWRSIVVVSDTWPPLFGLMEGWTATNLPSLESISMERTRPFHGMHNVDFQPRSLIGPMTIFGPQALLPKLSDLSLSAVHIDWDNSSDWFKNLRKLEIKNQTHDVVPTFEQFATMLSDAHRLECLDVSGFCPDYDTRPINPPLVRLPALKEFTFGWKHPEEGGGFLDIFQIGSSLETLRLVDTESDLGYWKDPQTKYRGWADDSELIFEVLLGLGAVAPTDENDPPSKAFISLRGVKKLEIIATKSGQRRLRTFLGMLTSLEDVRLEDVDSNVLEAVAQTVVDMAKAGRRLRLNLGWMWRETIPDFAEGVIVDLDGMPSIEVTTWAGEGQ